MRKLMILCLTMVTVMMTGCNEQNAHTPTADDSFATTITQSLVYINVTSNEYSQFQPWRRLDLSSRSGYGCAVGDGLVLTTARNMLDAEYIKVKWAGQTEYVEAKVKFIDYESDLCLLELNKESIRCELVPVCFSDAFAKNAELGSYWISSTGTLITGRGYLDSAKVKSATTSYTDILNLIVTNSSAAGSKGKLFCMNDMPVGIACLGGDSEVQLIPGEKINAFLADCADGEYKGFGSIGFSAERLVDPALRSYLKLGEDQTGGMLVGDVYTLGTGSHVLKKNDVILAIEGNALNSYGRYEDQKYGQIMYHHLITSRAAGDKVRLDVLRGGRMQVIDTAVKNFDVSEMVVPYYEYSKQPEFTVVGGYVFQRLTRPYLRGFGDDMKGSVPPHLYNYYSQFAAKPTPDKKGIVILSFVLPTEMSLGYHKLGRLVVNKYNGMAINSIDDIIAAQMIPGCLITSSVATTIDAQKLNPAAKYDIVEFEQDQPTVVIDRAALPTANQIVQQRYGVTDLLNVN